MQNEAMTIQYENDKKALQPMAATPIVAIIAFIIAFKK